MTSPLTIQTPSAIHTLTCRAGAYLIVTTWPGSRDASERPVSRDEAVEWACLARQCQGARHG